MGLHFIRPLWLLALIPSVVVFVMLLRRQDHRRIFGTMVASHLLPHLVSEPTVGKRPQPHVLLGMVLVVACLAMAGPTWQREPAPFADDTAALVIAMEVTPTMLARDVRPSRLERAVQKIGDLLERRRGASTALVAYAGSAHLVMPLTEDADLITDFTARLKPAIMPAKGDAADHAVTLAMAQLAAGQRSGSVLLVTDGVTTDAAEYIRQKQSEASHQVHVYGVAAGADAILPANSPPAPPLDRENLKNAATAGRGSLVLVTPDTTDVERLARIVETQFTPAASPEGGERWKDFGYWLVPVIALFVLWWFRPGWVIRWQSAPLLLLVLMLVMPVVYHAGNGGGQNSQPRGKLWFSTADQQAQRLFNAGQFDQAAKRFTEPWRQGAAWYRAGDFENAAAAFGRTDTPEGAFNHGNALLLLGDYAAAIESYQLALKKRPDWQAAAENQALARARLAKLAPSEDAQSQKAVGEDDEPDEIVFDDRAKDREDANTQTIAGAGEEMSDAALRALWLRRIQTDPAEFLRRKFAYQYSRLSGQGDTR